MKIQYFSDTNTLAIELTSKPVVATDSITDNDRDGEGKIVAITVDNCSRNVDTVDLQALDLPLLRV